MNKKEINIFIFVVIMVITLGIGYAAISNIILDINGFGTVATSQKNFKVHFTETPTITKDMGRVSIDEIDNTIATLEVTGLSKKGDMAKAVYTVINESSGVGAEFDVKISNTNKEYFEVTQVIDNKQLLAGETTLVTITVKLIKTPIIDGISTTIKSTIEAKPIDNTKTDTNNIEVVADTPFAVDSWDTIAENVRSGNTDQYKIGDTKEVYLGDEYGTHVVRVANKSTPEECSNEGYSQTACGFVVEFADIISEMQMRDSSTNKGGYPATLVFDYLKDDLFYSLPKDLQHSIIDTIVISGHGWQDNNGVNYISNCRLYLLSEKEVFGTSVYDTAAGQSRQLDFYSLDAIPNKSIKKYIQTSRNANWWLREGIYGYVDRFSFVYSDGYWSYRDYSNGRNGVSPAFRIG